MLDEPSVDAAEESVGHGYRHPRSRVTHALLRVLIGAGLVGLLIERADLGALSTALRQARYGLVMFAYGLILAAIVVGAFRWQPFARRLGFSLGIGKSIRLCIVGSFFNAFLPTGVGGDAYKALNIRRGSGTLARALVSVLFDRIAGFAGMAVLATAGAATQLLSGRRNPVVLVGLAAGIAGVLGYGLLHVIGTPVSRFGISAPRKSVMKRLVRLLAALGEGARDLHAMTVGLAMGVVTGLLLVAAQLVLGEAVGLSLPAGEMAALLLLTSLVAVIPLSINGLGLREATYVWGMAQFGVSRDAALAFALLALGGVLASSVIGGVLYALVDGGTRGDVQVSEERR